MILKNSEKLKNQFPTTHINIGSQTAVERRQMILLLKTRCLENRRTAEKHGSNSNNTGSSWEAQVRQIYTGSALREGGKLTTTRLLLLRCSATSSPSAPKQFVSCGCLCETPFSLYYCWKIRNFKEIPDKNTEKCEKRQKEKKNVIGVAIPLTHYFLITIFSTFFPCFNILLLHHKNGTNTGCVCCAQHFSDFTSRRRREWPQNGQMAATDACFQRFRQKFKQNRRVSSGNWEKLTKKREMLTEDNSNSNFTASQRFSCRDPWGGKVCAPLNLKLWSLNFGTNSWILQVSRDF